MLQSARFNQLRIEEQALKNSLKLYSARIRRELERNRREQKAEGEERRTR